MARKFIKDAWESYKVEVVPNDAPSVQIKESRQAFYAGASIIFNLIIENIGNCIETQEAIDDQAEILNDMQDEVNEFFAEIESTIPHLTKH